jgi:hypothetical protein
MAMESILQIVFVEFGTIAGPLRMSLFGAGESFPDQLIR